MVGKVGEGFYYLKQIVTYCFQNKTGINFRRFSTLACCRVPGLKHFSGTLKKGKYEVGVNVTKMHSTC